MLVLDANALVAYLRAEPGGEVVRGFLEDDETPIFAHALNMCELFYDFSRTDDVLVAREAVAAVIADGVQVRADLDTAFWEDAGQLKADWRRVSLADCCGLALARRLNADFVTADHHEMDVLRAAGVCGFTFFR